MPLDGGAKRCNRRWGELQRLFAQSGVAPLSPIRRSRYPIVLAVDLLDREHRLSFERLPDTSAVSTPLISKERTALR